MDQIIRYFLSFFRGEAAVTHALASLDRIVARLEKAQQKLTVETEESLSRETRAFQDYADVQRAEIELRNGFHAAQDRAIRVTSRLKGIIA